MDPTQTPSTTDILRSCQLLQAEIKAQRSTLIIWDDHIQSLHRELRAQEDTFSKWEKTLAEILQSSSSNSLDAPHQTSSTGPEKPMFELKPKRIATDESKSDREHAGLHPPLDSRDSMSDDDESSLNGSGTDLDPTRFIKSMRKKTNQILTPAMRQAISNINTQPAAVHASTHAHAHDKEKNHTEPQESMSIGSRAPSDPGLSGTARDSVTSNPVVLVSRYGSTDAVTSEEVPPQSNSHCVSNGLPPTFAEPSSGQEPPQKSAHPEQSTAEALVDPSNVTGNSHARKFSFTALKRRSSINLKPVEEQSGDKISVPEPSRNAQSYQRLPTPDQHPKTNFDPPPRMNPDQQLKTQPSVLRRSWTVEGHGGQAAQGRHAFPHDTSRTMPRSRTTSVTNTNIPSVPHNAEPAANQPHNQSTSFWSKAIHHGSFFSFSKRGSVQNDNPSGTEESVRISVAGDDASKVPVTASRLTLSRRLSVALASAIFTPEYDELGRATERRTSNATENTQATDMNAKKGTMSLTKRTGIHPFSPFKLRWELFMIAVYFFIAIPLPCMFSFEVLSSGPGIAETSWILSAILAIEMLVQFATLRFKGGTSNELCDLQQSAIKYVLSIDFILDVVSMIPWDAVARARGQPHSELFVVFKMLCFKNFIYIANRNPVVKGGKNYVYSTLKIPAQFANLFTLFFGLILAFHWEGCMMFMMGKLINYEGELWSQDTDILKQDFIYQYIFSYIRSMGNMFTIGHEPDFWGQQLGTILSVYGAGFLWAGVVGITSSISFGLNASSRLFRQKMDELNEYLDYKRVDDDLKSRVREYMEFKYRGKYFDENAILEELNNYLRDRIVVQKSLELVTKVPFLLRNANDGRDKIFIQKIAKCLKPAHYLKGDIIFEQGDEAHEMYFIFVGAVEIIVGGRAVGQLHEGAFFGEVALLGNTTRTAAIRASANCIMYVLGRKDLNKVLVDYPDMVSKLEAVFMERMKKVAQEKADKEKANKK
ncbi:hypothetical protein HK102_010644 [Quaeritorhiza haematococci]|nr:hypothetical protein HK102_010644 [Quaeritorhiza haematococci]